jgi:hypothetical protein
VRIRLLDPATGAIQYTDEHGFLELIAGTNVTIAVTEKGPPDQPTSHDDAASVTITSTSGGGPLYTD